MIIHVCTCAYANKTLATFYFNSKKKKSERNQLCLMGLEIGDYITILLAGKTTYLYSFGYIMWSFAEK